MKKYIFLALALLIAFPAFAVDTTIAGIDLTDKQLSQSDTLRSDVVKGIAAWPSEHKVVVVSTRDLTNDEVIALRSELLALPDAYSQAAIEAQFNSEQFLGRLIQEFDQARWFALSKLGVGWTMQQLVDYPNFPGLKAYANGLLADGTITLEDAGKINACLLEQGIDLASY